MAQARVVDADIIVVGAGIAGAACAAALAEAGLAVTLIERGPPGGAVSGGSLACIGTHMLSEEELPLIRWSCAAWAEFAAASRQGFEYRRCGQLRFIDRTEDVEIADRWLRIERAQGLMPVLLAPEEVRKVEPALTGGIVAATWSPDDAMVNPFLAVRAYLAKARASGATVMTRQPVSEVVLESGNVAGVRCGEEIIRAPRVLLAAGPWTARLAASAGVKLALQPRRAQCLASVRQPTAIRTVVGACESAGGVEAGYTQIQQAANGQILFNTVKAGGQGNDGDQDMRREVDPDFVYNSIATLLRLFPGLEGIELLRSWVRYEAVTPDDRFLIGPAGPEGLFIAAGDGGTGFVRAPAIARTIVCMVTGQEPLWDTRLYAPERFAETP